MLKGNKSEKTVFLLSASVLIIFCIFVFTVITDNKPRPVHKTQNIYDQFRLEKVSIRSLNDNKLFFILNAEKIVHRGRTAKLFRYHNLKELYFLDVELEFFSDESIFSSDKSIPDAVGSGLIENVGNIFMENHDDLRKEDDANIDISVAVAKPDYKIITRMIIDNLFIKLHHKDGSSVKISSDNAVINIDSRNIEFKRNFSIVDVNNKKITAPEAIWIYKSNVICFPKGHTLYPFRSQEQSSFVIDASGNLKKTKYPANNKLKKDRIQEMEKFVITKYIAPYLNAFYASLLTKGKFDPAIFKKQRQFGKKGEENIYGKFSKNNPEKNSASGF